MDSSNSLTIDDQILRIKASNNRSSITVEDIKDFVSVGVELEFILALPKSANVGILEEFSKLIPNALGPVGAKYSVKVYQTGHMSDSTSALLDATGDMCEEVLHNGFHIQFEPTITIPPDRLDFPIEYRSAEVSTPILRKGIWRGLIPDMCMALKTDKEFKLKFNDSTGLHIHIGIGRDYTLQDLKRISMAIILFEEKMDFCHPVSRCHTFSTDMHMSQIASNRHNKFFERLGTLQCINEIEKSTDIYDLFSKINCDPFVVGSASCRSYKYNILASENYGTIEFRQAIAVDDGAKILKWVDQTIRFVVNAISTDEQEFKTWASLGVDGIEPVVYERFGVPIRADEERERRASSEDSEL